MSDLVERLRDLHKQATVERSHYYVGKCALDAADRIEALEAGLSAAVRAANFALFVIRKKGVMPNSSWETGFECDMKTARAALAPEPDK